MTDGNGLFVVRYDREQHKDGGLILTYGGTSLQTSFDGEPSGGGTYGPFFIVTDLAMSDGCASAPPQPLLLTNDEFVKAVKAAPGLFFRNVAVPDDDPCNAYFNRNYASRSFRYDTLSVLGPSSTPYREPGSIAAILGALEGYPYYPPGGEIPLPNVPKPPDVTKRVRFSSDYAAGLDGFRFGLQVTYEQNWFELGHSLGKLLYSLALAPGEETKVGTVDWRRTQAASASSSLDETASQQSTSEQTDLVAQAVQMSQQSKSVTDSNSDTTTVGMSASVPVGPTPITIGGSISDSQTTTHSTVKNAVDATQHTAQSINQRTQAASSALRSTRSMSVAEVAEAETSTVSTRVVRNHNHCHTLTIQYYEVLQHQLISTRAIRVRPVIYVPFEQFNFWDDAIISRYRAELANVLIDRTYAQFMLTGKARPHNAKTVLPSSSLTGVPPYFDLSGTLVSHLSPADRRALRVSVTTASKTYDFPLSNFSDTNDPSTGQFSLVFEPREVVGAPADPITSVTLYNGGNDLTASSLKLSAVYLVNGLADDRRGIFQVEDVTVPSGGSISAVQGPFGDTSGSGDANTYPSVFPDDLKRHLQNYAFFYTRKIIERMDPYMRYLVLAGTPIGKDDPAPRLADIAENEVLGGFGNYLGMPLHSFRYLPAQYYKEGDEQSTVPAEEHVVTLPTQAIFAESQMGSCSACETIDDARFWDWQKSPIPEDAPAVTGAMLASRYEDMSNMLKVVSSNLVAPSAPSPLNITPALTIGDQSFAAMLKEIDFGNDPQKAADFIGAILRAIVQAQSGTAAHGTSSPKPSDPIPNPGSNTPAAPLESTKSLTLGAPL